MKVPVLWLGRNGERARGVRGVVELVIMRSGCTRVPPVVVVRRKGVAGLVANCCYHCCGGRGGDDLAGKAIVGDIIMNITESKL